LGDPLSSRTGVRIPFGTIIRSAGCDPAQHGLLVAALPGALLLYCQHQHPALPNSTKRVLAPFDSWHSDVLHAT
jgi:hypothetical protein